MPPLVVEIDDFVAAAKTMSDKVADPVGRSLTLLSDSLHGCVSMAGDDPGGQSWAQVYDDAAWSVVQATGHVVNAAYRTAGMFGRSALNYAAAESASTASGGASLEPHILQALPATSLVGDPEQPPTANGAGGDDSPFGWWLVQHSVGYVWPNGDTGLLRAAAEAWDHCGSALSTDTCVIGQVTTPFTQHALPEADDMVTVCNGFQRRLGNLGNAHRQLASACREYAGHLDHCHDEIVNELDWLLGESTLLQAGGLLASAFTAGQAEWGVQTAEAGRIALAAERIAQLIQAFLKAARDVVETIKNIARAAKEIRIDLESLSNTRLAIAGATPAAGLPAAGRAAGGVGAFEKARIAYRARKELAATKRLADEAETGAKVGRPGNVVSAGSRTHILDGDGPGLGGGHRWPGGPGKTPFPKSWSDDQIIDNVGDIVSSPATRWHVQSGNGGYYTKGGDPAVWRAWEVRDGVRIRVAWEPATGRIRTGFPDDGPVIGELVP